MTMARILSKDFLAGVMFIAFGAFALWLTRHLPMGTAVRMGPGYVPQLFAYALLVLGSAIAIVAFATPGDKPERPQGRPLLLVTIGIVVFGLLLETAGLLPALIVLVAASSYANGSFRVAEVLFSILVLAALSITVFKLGLGMNVQIIAGVW